MNNRIGAYWEAEAEEAVKRLDAIIVKRRGVIDYEGWCCFLIEKDNKYGVVKWVYGTCSGCDPWVELKEERHDQIGEKVVQAILDTSVEWFKTEAEARQVYNDAYGW